MNDLSTFEEIYASEASALFSATAGTEPFTASFPRDDQFLYTRRMTLQLQPVRTLQPGYRPEPPRLVRHDEPTDALPRAFVTNEHRGWSSATRSGRWEHHQLRVRFTTIEAQRGWEELGSPTLLARSPTAVAPTGEHTYRVGNISLSQPDLLDFPTDPQIICERLLATRPEDPAKVLSQLVEALHSGPKPAALRAGIYGALLLQPTVREAGEAADGAGRQGLALRYSREDQDQDHEVELIFDRNSLELMGERRRALGALARRLAAPAGMVIEDTVILERGVAEEIPEAIA